MARAINETVELEYECFGAPEQPTILLINGLGAQMTRFPSAFCERLAAQAFQVIRFDNRDAGLSTWPLTPYTLADMARDAVAVLDASGVGAAHLAGSSMGGMIAQRVAIDHPGRVLSLTSIMSTTGAVAVTQSTPEASAVLRGPTPDPASDFEAFVAHGVASMRIIGSPAYPWSDEESRARVIDDYRRAFNPSGVSRQMAAVMADGDRTEALRALTLPVVVVHGESDPLIMKCGGEATAAAIPQAELRIVPGMGHDLPPALYGILINAIICAARRAMTEEAAR